MAALDSDANAPDPLVAERVCAGTRRTQILNDVSLSLKRRAVTAILGANGAGKSTLLRTLAGTLVPSSGRVTLNGKRLGDYSRMALARALGVIPQHTDMTLELTVRGVVSMGRFCHRPFFASPSPRDLAVVESALSAMALERLADRAANTLSGGERQRMFLAQLLAQESEIVLLDEPTAHLDVKYQIEMLRTFRRLVADRHWTACVVLHDLRLAYRFCDRLAFLRQGRLIAVGDAQEMANPELVRDTFDVEAYFTTTDDRPDVTVVI